VARQFQGQQVVDTVRRVIGGALAAGVGAAHTHYRAARIAGVGALQCPALARPRSSRRPGSGPEARPRRQAAPPRSRCHPQVEGRRYSSALSLSISATSFGRYLHLVTHKHQDTGVCIPYTLYCAVANPASLL
jgi:hypothetical protein